MWPAPVLDPVALDVPLGSLETARHGPRVPGGFPRSDPAPTPSAMSEPARHTIFSLVESVVTRVHVREGIMLVTIHAMVHIETRVGSHTEI